MDKALPMLESSFGGWKAQGAAAAPAAMPAVPEITTRTIYLVDKPGAPQSQSRIGWVGVPRSTPDYFPILVNTIPAARSPRPEHEPVREERYTYGAARLRHASVGRPSSPPPARTIRPLRRSEFFNELNGISSRCRPRTSAARKTTCRCGSSRVRDDDRLAQTEDAIVYHLPDDYFQMYAIKRSRGGRAARGAELSSIDVVVIGDRKVIEPGIQALKLGTIKILTIDDVFGPPPVL